VAVLAVYAWTVVMQRAGNAIQIQSVKFGASETVIYVQNVGKGTVTIESAYINQLEFNVNSTNCIVGSQKTNTVMEGQTAQITVNRAFEGTIKVRVTCSDGTFHEGEFEKERT